MSGPQLRTSSGAASLAGFASTHIPMATAPSAGGPLRRAHRSHGASSAEPYDTDQARQRVGALMSRTLLSGPSSLPPHDFTPAFTQSNAMHARAHLSNASDSFVISSMSSMLKSWSVPNQQYAERVMGEVESMISTQLQAALAQEPASPDGVGLGLGENPILFLDDEEGGDDAGVLLWQSDDEEGIDLDAPDLGDAPPNLAAAPQLVTQQSDEVA